MEKDMGQSGKTRPNLQSGENLQIAPATALEVAFFATELGWFGLWGAEGKVVSLSFGHDSRDQVRRAGECLVVEDARFESCRERDWNPDLRRSLERFSSGMCVDFSDVEVEFPPQTHFQKRVVAALRRVKYGETVTYGELAAEAGFPGAARAVGSVMAANRTPIIVPCHRVVAAGHRLGGFSAPRGIEMKQQLLEMEAQCLVCS
jgi:methylated-DNA-[protein]-cysteine S-methyltransferase